MFSIFSQAEYQEVMLPFQYVYDKEDEESGIIGIEMFGPILGETKYCYACYVLNDKSMYNNGDYEQLIDLLKNNNTNKMVKVKIKIKKNKAKDFELDLKSLVEIYNDNRFDKLELLGSGISNTSTTNKIKS